MGCGI